MVPWMLVLQWSSYPKSSQDILIGFVDKFGIPGHGNQDVLAFSVGDSLLASNLLHPQLHLFSYFLSSIISQSEQTVISSV